MNYKEALDKISEYTYALLYKYNEIKLCKVRDKNGKVNGEIWKDWEDCTEARIFSTSGELHFFTKEELVYEVSDENNGKYSDIYYILHDSYKTLGKKVVVRRYLEIDEDGQTYISRTRLYDIR